ncbi:MAG TPA: TonB-dependent receptor [Gemmatimonadales bacterium]|nr:TonB-dependent receptor [Gemmatimonadales bacterium]
MVTRLFVLAGIVSTLFGIPAAAQAPGGSIAGVVRARGIAASGARVTATNQATGAVGRATSTADGRYAIAGLAPGAYTVGASLPGLRTLSNRDVQVTGAAATTVDFDLQPLTLEAITVTAMLREQQLAKVPFSIAAPTQEALRVRGADNIEAVAANVADFSVQNLGPGQSQVAMRGISSGQIARDQPGVKEEVGAYLDEVPVSLSLFTPDLDLFDLSRVEVLRGPQGTLFGAGSLGGTVRYITNQPELHVRDNFVETGTSWIDGGSPGSAAKLGFNEPLGDKAAVRIVGYANQLGGYMNAVQPSLRVDQNVNGGSRSGARAMVRLAPSGRLTITPGIGFQRVDMNGWNRIDTFNILANSYTTSRPKVTLGGRTLFTQMQEPFTDDFLLADLNVRYDFGGVSLTSVSAWTHRDVLVVRDGTALSASILGGSIGLPENIYTINAGLNDATKTNVATQEVRLSGGRDRVRWVVGGFYAGNHRHYGQDLLIAGFDTLAAPIFNAPYGFTRGLLAPKDHLFWSDLHYYLRQTAAFGEATVPVGARLDLTAGIRYYNFREQRDQIFDGFFGNNNNGQSLVTQPGRTSAHGVAPRFIASYKVSDAVTVNAQASRGFRLGGINDPLNVPVCTPQDLTIFSGHDSWKDEKVWNYEAGMKAQSGRSTISLSAFDMEVTDLQLTVTAGSCTSRLILNAPKARSQGVEAEVTLAPGEHWDVALSAAFNNGKLQSDLKDGAGNIISGIKSGNRLPSVPQVQLSGAATYGWFVTTGSRAFISGSYQYSGSHYTLIDDEAPGAGTVNLAALPHTVGGPLTQTTFTFNPLLPGYSIVNLRAGLSRARWEVAAYASNLTDTRAFLALDRERGTLARVGYLTNQPRTLGVTLRFSY